MDRHKCYECGEYARYVCDECGAGMCESHMYRCDDGELCNECAIKEGLLRRGGVCFIATCVYGNYAEETNILRQWRDVSLLTNHFGIWFTNTYYKISPHIVNFIKNKPILKTITRKMLNPLVKKLKKRYNQK